MHMKLHVLFLRYKMNFILSYRCEDMKKVSYEVTEVINIEF